MLLFLSLRYNMFSIQVSIWIFVSSRTSTCPVHRHIIYFRTPVIPVNFYPCVFWAVPETSSYFWVSAAWLVQSHRTFLQLLPLSLAGWIFCLPYKSRSPPTCNICIFQLLVTSEFQVFSCALFVFQHYRYAVLLSICCHELKDQWFITQEPTQVFGCSSR
jgi:hypothetical protein